MVFAVAGLLFLKKSSNLSFTGCLSQKESSFTKMESSARAKYWRTDTETCMPSFLILKKMKSCPAPPSFLAINAKLLGSGVRFSSSHTCPFCVCFLSAVPPPFLLADLAYLFQIVAHVVILGHHLMSGEAPLRVILKELLGFIVPQL